MLSPWLLAAIIIIAIVLIALGIGWINRNNNYKNAPKTPNLQGLTHPLVWSNPPTPGSNPYKNTCQIYQFPTSIGQSGIALVGAPTLNSATLNKMDGILLVNQTCIDTDQVIAQQVQHSCTGPAGVLDNSSVRCITLGGKTVGFGEIENYYDNVLCPVISQCPGQLSLVSLNYHGLGETDMYCINKTHGGSGLATMAPCDPSNEDQLFRITRVNPGQNPDSLPPGSQNGLLAQMYDRDTGQCLVPYDGSSDNLFTYYPTYVEKLNSACTGGPYSGYTGTHLTLGSCTGGPYPGYVWVLFPSISYCGVTAGCSGCTSGYTRLPSSNQCCNTSNVCPASAGFESYSTPQQIFYIGNVNYNDIPIKGSSSDIFAWLIANNAPRLFFGGDTSGNGYPYLIYPSTAILPGVDNSTCTGLSSTDNYLNLTLYNTLVQEAPCVVSNVSQSYCLF
jgi:hypothetical protein